MGMGIAMGRTPLIDDDLRAGRLVCPFDLRLKTPQSYYLVARPQIAQTPKYRAFRDWIMEKARAVTPWPDQTLLAGRERQVLATPSNPSSSQRA